ncbi:MAG: Mur ligase family protein [Microbacteriaceae bacterium]
MASFRPQHVRTRSVANLAETFAGDLRGDSAVIFSGVTSSSSAVVPGDVFVALPGASAHGARYVADAISAGAVAVLTDAAGAEQLTETPVPVVVIEHPREAMGLVSSWLYETGRFAEDLDRQLIFGVTGTNGKTSVSYLLAAIAAHLGQATALSSTAERRVGEEVLVSGLTTPESNEIHALLAAARERGIHTAVLEVSAHALTRKRVDGVLFDVVGFSNFSQDHLDDYADMESYYAAKRELFSPDRARRGVINVDDEWGRRLVGESRIPVTTLSLSASSDADWLVRLIDERADRTRFALEHSGRSIEVTVPLLGAFSATNAALAIVMFVEAGFDLDSIAEALGPNGVIDVYIPGRAEAVSGERGPLVLIDYAHTPDAYEQLLAALGRVARGRIVMVFGADGDRDSSKRAEMGAIAARGASTLVVTDYHPRFEDPASIRAALIAGARAAVPEREIHEIADPREAFRAALALASDDDIVLYAGPGHEDYHEVAGQKIPYSARADARAALREAGWLDD